MSSSASNLSNNNNNNNNKETSVSVSVFRSGTKFKTAGLNDLANQKVSTSTAAIKSSTHLIESAAIGPAVTAVTPMKSQEEIVSITESEEKNTSPAPSTTTEVVDSSKHDSSAAVTTTLSETIEMDDSIQKNDDRKRFSNGINDSNSGKQRGPGRPSKKASSPISSAASSAPSSSSSAASPATKTETCAWCSENKSILQYVLPTPNGDKEFCSELCIAEFRKALKKGACSQCGNVVRPNVAPNREFCSTFCMNKVQTSISGRNGKSIASK